MLPNRKPPAPLLRPKPRPAFNRLSAALLLLVGGLGGFVLGIALQPLPSQRDAAPTLASAPALPREFPTAPTRPAGDPRIADLRVVDPRAGDSRAGDPRLGAAGSLAGSAASTGGGGQATETQAFREAQTAEEARLAAAMQARVAAETQLADLQRQVARAAARRDALQGEAGQPGPREFSRDLQPGIPRDGGLAAREPAMRREPSPPPGASLALVPPPAPPRPTRFDPPAGSTRLPRIVVHHRAGSPAAAETAAAITDQLREAGFEAGEVKGVAAVPAQRVVRYFHADDAPTAARLAGRLGRGWAIQDFRSFEPSPPPGLLEVWLP